MSGRVAWLSMTPVKGLRLHCVDTLTLDTRGVRGDRCFALSDPAGHLVNGKTVPTLLQVVAEHAAERQELTLRFPRGEVVTEVVRLGAPAALHAYGGRRPARLVVGPWAAALSAWVGRELQMLRLETEGNGVDRPGSGAVTLLSTASVAALAGAAQTATVDPDRFRMSVGVAGVAAFAEEAWRGLTVAVGEAEVRVWGNVGRCSVTTLHPATGVPDLRTLHLLGDLRAGVAATEPLPFGVHAQVVTPGRVRLGDPVVAVTPAR